jgi:HEAT repeat protein
MEGGTPTRVSKSTVRERAIEIVEELAKHENAQIRANAVEAAGETPKRLRGVIEAGLSDKVSGVRSIAALAVGRSKTRELVPKVEPLRKDAEPHVQVSAIYALVRNGREVDQTLLADHLLSPRSAWVSRHAAFVIGELGNRTALPLLQSAAANRARSLGPGQQRVFQIQIAEAMIKLGEDEHKPVLRAALYPQQPEDLEAAVLAVQVLGEVQDRESIGQLINLLNYRDRAGQPYPVEVRLAIATALGRMGEETGEVGDAFLESENAVWRSQAAFVYGAQRAGQAWDRLARLMEDPEPIVRIAAAAAVLKSER